MKLRIDPEKISFRIDFDELEKLLNEGEIKETTALPHGNLVYKVICLPAGLESDFQAADGAYILSLARNILEDHKSALPSLKGIKSEFNGKATVTLEVNLKKKVKRSLG